MTETTEYPWCRHGINKSGYCADCKVNSLITTIESLQKDNEQLRSLLSELRPLIGSELSEDAVKVAQKEIDFALSHTKGEVTKFVIASQSESLSKYYLGHFDVPSGFCFSVSASRKDATVYKSHEKAKLSAVKLSGIMGEIFIVEEIIQEGDK